MNGVKCTGLALCTGVMLLTAPLYADIPYNAWWQKANKFYSEQAYDSAAFYYEKLAAQQPEGVEVYYNLGNTYYRLNRIGPAVLNYERALKIDPGHKAANDNLELTKSRIANRIQQPEDIFFVAWWKSITASNLATMWSVLSLVLFIFLLVLIWLRKTNFMSCFPFALTPATLFLFILTILFAYAASGRKVAKNRAVVMEQDAPLFQGTKTSGTPILIPEGTVLSIEAEENDRVQVRLPDGRNGWMRINTLERI